MCLNTLLNKDLNPQFDLVEQMNLFFFTEEKIIKIFRNWRFADNN